MRRSLFTLLSVLSMVLCIVTCVLWARGIRKQRKQEEFIQAYNQEWQKALVGVNEQARVAFHAQPWAADTTRSMVVSRNKSMAILRTYYPHRPFAIYAFVAGLTGMPPTIWLVRAACHQVVVKRRSQRNFCTACGYDLRATPDRCPECGMVPTPAKVKA
jgi:hypothetical protein